VSHPVRVYTVNSGITQVVKTEQTAKSTPVQPAEKASIAILPFDNISTDPEQEYFCDGITENIIATLAQTQLLLVIARNSTFAYKNKPINIQQIGQELNVEYVIEGSIQKSNDLIRIVIQLIDTDSGLHIWSERYDREFKDIFNLQDEITLEILKAVGIKLKGLGGDKSLFEGVTDISSFIKIVKVRHYYENPTKEGYASALKNAKEIIVSNPEYLHRYDLLAVVYLTGISLDPLQSSIKRLLLASEAVKKSLSLDENNYLAYQLLGWIFFNKKEFDKGITAYKKSLVLNPTSADAYSAIGFALNCNDNPSEALERMKIAFRLNPDPPAIYLDTLGWSYSGVGQHEKAIETYKTLLRRKPNYWSAYLMLTYSYISIGQEENAKTAVKKLLILVPDYSITKFKKFTFIKKNREVRLEGVAIALRKAGLPE
ncbi:MAG: tetratricopeptide repeat protein, partial [Desulfobacula sp.]|uniref:tetratricopeptide repeat protein n=1 Tax=Desulfobacula sp. TaxID=2593537 RepID=UPI0039B82C4B|nr:tetratricopeptide repeat protein [Desulfobacula sp.]